MISSEDTSLQDNNGGIRELAALFFPIMLMTFSACISLFVEKLIFGRVSAEVMEVAVSAAYACQIFQGSCVGLVMMAQVFIGRWCGASDYKLVGPGMWQFIWFSCLAMLLVVPLGIVYGQFYFSDVRIQSLSLPYYYWLICASFLFTLGAALSCFFLGQKKVKLILFATLGMQFVKLLTAYLFVFGIEGFLPAFGLMGGIISTLIAQGGFCLFLFLVFLNKKNHAFLNTRTWQFQPKLFWECIYPGLLRAMSRVLTFISWASIAQLMTMRGGDHLLVLSIGGTLFLFLPFLGEAICQAQTTIVSQILGAETFSLLSKAFKSGIILVSIIAFIVSIPLLLFDLETFRFLFPNITLSSLDIQNVFLGVWLSFVFFALGFIPMSYILAFKDTKFSLFMGCVNWINGFSLMYFAIEKIDIPAAQFWTTLSIMHFTTFVIYVFRMRWLQTRNAAFLALK